MILEFLTKYLLEKCSKRLKHEQLAHLFVNRSDHIGQTVMVNGLYEKAELRFLFDQVFTSQLNRFRDSLAIDIGANIGNHTCFFSCYFREVLAFEPNSKISPVIEVNANFNNLDNIKVYPYALSNDKGKARLRIKVYNIGGSYIDDNEQSDVSGDYLEIEKKTGDSVLETTEGNIALIKLDVEGYELKVLQGLEETIRNHQPFLMFEAHESGEATAENMMNMLKKYGYNYFYEVSRSKLKTNIKFMRILWRLFSGFKMNLYAIEKPQNQFYQMIIASPEAIAESSKK